MAKKKATESYYELLQHPEWQKVRLKVMERAEFACEHCDCTDKQLSIHHSYYESKKKPWEYPLESLHCLCGDCHRAAQDLKTLLNRQLGKIGVSSDLEMLLGFARALEAESFPMVVIDVASWEMAFGVAACFQLTPEMVIGALIEGTIDGYKLVELRTQIKRASKQGE